ncbi:MAG: hypothetical protein M1816_004550 [Peltula sp. TS41687]|nr:MAG: hypothetical protein M1816_004550 [Peltula sp. TS41687]
MKPPRIARNTRQQTLTQIDFVSRIPRFEETWESEDDDEDFEEEMRPPASKRRRKSCTRQQRAGEEDEEEEDNDDRSDLRGLGEATPPMVRARSPAVHDHGKKTRKRGPSTPKSVRILEIPSSRRSPVQKPLFVTQAEDKALVEKSGNAQVRTGGSASERKRKELKGILPPKLEVQDTYADENDMSQLPELRLLLEGHVSTVPMPVDGAQSDAEADEPATTVQWKEEESSIMRQHDRDLPPSTSTNIVNPPLKSSIKFEIQDSETEETSDDDDNDDNEDMEVNDPAASNTSTSSGSQTQPQPPNGPEDASDDDEYLPSGESETGAEEQESQYPIGLETQAVVDAIDLSSSSEFIPLHSDSTEGQSLESTPTTKRPQSDTRRSPIIPQGKKPHFGSLAAASIQSAPSPSNEQESQHLYGTLQSEHPRPSSAPPSKIQGTADPEISTHPAPISPSPTNGRNDRISGADMIPNNDVSDDDDDNAETPRRTDNDAEDAVADINTNIEGPEPDNRDFDLDGELELDDDASETMSQLLPESLMASFVPPPPPLLPWQFRVNR